MPAPQSELSHRTPTLNHVERTPSSRRTDVGLTETSPWAVTAVSAVTRRDELSVVRRSVTAPPVCRTRPSLAPPNAIGPHVWYGEIESYGSGTDTRYGTAVPQTSSDDAVRPPDVEKKNVFATWPL